MIKSGIYLITNVINGKQYNGKAKNLKKRVYQHWSDLKAGKHSNPHLQNAYHKYGRAAFHYEVLEYVEIRDKETDPKGHSEDLKYLVERECWWTDLLNCMDPKGYVLRKGGGKEVSDETRAKISAIKMGKPSPMKGKTQTLEARNKIGTANKGRASWYKGVPRSQEVKAKISASKMGHNVSEETKAKISTTKKDRTNERLYL